MNPEVQPTEGQEIVLNPEDSNDPQVKKWLAEGAAEAKAIEEAEKAEEAARKVN